MLNRPQGMRMTLQAARPGVPARIGQLRGGRKVLAAGALLSLMVLACDDVDIGRIREEYEIVGGQPRVDPAQTSVDRRDELPPRFASNAPFQADSFLQRPVSRVDILWVIDNSGSMGFKQTQLRDNFEAFVAKLVEHDETLDWRIGVVTTDVSDPLQSGRLRNRVQNPLVRPWISRDTCHPDGCDAVAAFRDIASVGVHGSDDEKGLYAAMLALSPPLTGAGGHNEGFLRPDASLFVLIVSDEEDSSCSPILSQYGGGCLEPVHWGSPDYYTRFFNGLKGPGREGLVSVGVIVSTERQPVQLRVDGVQRNVSGCTISGRPGDGGVHAPRYIAVAEGTGGSVASICEDDYLPALERMGYLASGALDTFVLSRAPFAESIQVHVTEDGERRRLQPGADYRYVACREGAAVNAVQFTAGAMPSPGSRIDVEYAVNVRGLSCQ